VQLVLTPAQHWSARGIMDRRKTLWGGWAALGERSRFWFAGDTGYAPVFKVGHASSSGGRGRFAARGNPPLGLALP
jgi:L-ascorbate metabolism protein UlaG (beta-lactamase superfamily)